jgi:hypothetical protein
VRIDAISVGMPCYLYDTKIVQDVKCAVPNEIISGTRRFGPDTSYCIARIASYQSYILGMIELVYV